MWYQNSGRHTQNRQRVGGLHHTLDKLEWERQDPYDTNFTNKRPVRLEEAGEKTLNMKGDGIYLFMAAGPLLRSSWEKSRGKVAPSVWLWDSGECRWKPEWLEIAIIRFDHVVEEQHWNSEAEALNQISAEMMDFFFSSNAVFIFHSKHQQKTSEDIDLISIDLSRCIGLVYLTSTSI